MPHIVEDLVGQHPGLEREVSSRGGTIRVGVGEWDTPALLTAKEDWRTPSGRILLFGIYNKPSRLEIALYLFPGPDTTRQRILDVARDNPEFFSTPRDVKPDVPLRIYSRTLLGREAHETLDDEAREQEIRRQWGGFLDRDLRGLTAALKRETWVWEPVE